MPKNIRQQPIFISTGDPETVNDATLLYPGQLGMRVTLKRPSGPGTPGSPNAPDYRDKTYQLVGTDSTMTTSPYPGAVAWWADKPNYKVTTDGTKLGRGRIAGVFRNNITPGNFCFVQTQGPAAVKLIDSPNTAPTTNSGQYIIPSSTTGKADCLAAGAAATYPPLGVVGGALNLGDNTVVTDLDVPETT